MLTQERLKELLKYDPETGDFWWIAERQKGQYAGTQDKGGYIHIQVDCHRYPAGRLAVLYMTGKWPNGDVDHINKRSDDNRWKNLREATRSQNKANGRKYKNNFSGFKGVCWNARQKKYQGQISCNGRQMYLGYFSSPEEAARAYDKKAVELFGEYACLNFPEPSNIET